MVHCNIKVHWQFTEDEGRNFFISLQWEYKNLNIIAVNQFANRQLSYRFRDGPLARAQARVF